LKRLEKMEEKEIDLKTAIKKHWSSWELYDFNLKKGEVIDLRNKCGFQKIERDKNGILQLIGEDNMRDAKKPAPSTIANPDSILGFVLDIGIRKEKFITNQTGCRFDIKLTLSQSKKEVSRKDFNKILFERIVSYINSNFQSSIEKRKKALKLKHLFDSYNNARLLYPNFHNESYMNLMRIMEALSNTCRALGFAAYAALVSPKLNENIYQKASKTDSYKRRVEIANRLFQDCLKNTKNDKKVQSQIENLDEPGKMIFSCFYSLYQYRNKFVHEGFPFPGTVTQSIGLENDSISAYLHPSSGSSFTKMFRPDGLKKGDLIDIHESISQDNEKFREKYYLLLPTWYCVKCLTREALLKQII